MGTSKSQGSPSTPPWNAVKKAYQKPDIDNNRISQLLWRAGSSEPSTNLIALLGQPVAFSCLNIILKSEDIFSASHEATRNISRDKHAGITAEIARRAIISSFETPEKTKNYIASLFKEATNYLISRDLSTLVGTSPRLEELKNTTKIKMDILEITQNKVFKMDIPRKIPNYKSWCQLIESIGDRLKK
ncbi:MAG: hypothetical protein ACFFHV_23785 [Promethearchaeota archaeon]